MADGYGAYQALRKLTPIADGDAVKRLVFFCSYASGKDGGGSVRGIEPDDKQS